MVIEKGDNNMSYEITSRQWKLYEFLKICSDRFTTQRDIYEGLKDNGDYTMFVGEDKVFHDSLTRMEIGLDIQHLNESDVIQKIILTNSNGVKIADEEEYKVYSLNRWKSIKGMIKRLAWKDNKAKLNGQMKLVFGDSMARDFYETFAEEFEKELK
jgi:hypothetical protein